MSLWKYSFELVNRELDLARKKQQALDELFASEKISQSTHEYLEGELKEAISDLEAHLKSLTEKMTARAQDLEKQISTLELALAKLEIYHAAGEIDNEAYERQSKAILLGLEVTKQELIDIKNSLLKTISKTVETSAASTPPEIAEVKKTTESCQENKGEGTSTEPLGSENLTLIAPSEKLSE